MPRRTAADAAQTRTALIEAGRRLFAQQGYAAAATGEIARVAGVTEGALFHHFSGKARLFRAVFDMLQAQQAADVRAAFQPQDPLAGFLCACDAAMAFAARPDFQQIVLRDGPAVLGAEAWRAADTASGLGLVTSGVQGLMTAGLIPAQPVKPLALALFGVMNEAAFALARGEPGIDASDMTALLQRLLGV